MVTYPCADVLGFTFSHALMQTSTWQTHIALKWMVAQQHWDILQIVCRVLFSQTWKQLFSISPCHYLTCHCNANQHTRGPTATWGAWTVNTGSKVSGSIWVMATQSIKWLILGTDRRLVTHGREVRLQCNPNYWQKNVSCEFIKALQPAYARKLK